MTKAVKDITCMSSTEIIEAGKVSPCSDIEKNAETKNSEKGEYIVGGRLQIVIIVYGLRSMTRYQRLTA